MAEFITALFNGSSSPFSITPKTNYQKNVPQNAKQLSKNNWLKTGSSLRSAVKKVGKEIGKE